jgi:hypothetical protein
MKATAHPLVGFVLGFITSHHFLDPLAHVQGAFGQVYGTNFKLWDGVVCLGFTPQ